MSVIVDEITNDITVIVGSGGVTTTWDNLEGKPTTFAPTIGTTASTALAGNTPIPVIPSTMSQAEAQAGTATTQRTITAERLAQAIAALSPAAVPVSPISVIANKTLTQADHGTMQYITAATTISVLTNSLEPSSLGTQVDYFQAGTGAVTFSPGSGVVIISKNGSLSTSGQGSAATLKKLFGNTWALIIAG